MNKFNLLCERILNEMNRKDFLKTLGKAAGVTSVSPGSVGKMAMNLATGAKLLDINKLTTQLIKSISGEVWNSDVKLADSGLRSMYSNFLTYFTQHGLANKKLKKELTQTIDYLSPANIQKWIDGGGFSGDGGPLYTNKPTVEDFFTNFFEMQLDEKSYEEIMKVLFTNNLVSQANAKLLYDLNGEQWFDYVNTPAARKAAEKEYSKIKADNDEQMRKFTHDYIAKDINYSRMDTAGGSEDVGYSKYYEKYNRSKKK